jgi:hypothetical protein
LITVFIKSFTGDYPELSESIPHSRVTYFFKISLMLSTHVRLYLPSCPNKMYSFIISPICNTGAEIAQWYCAGLRAGWSGVRVPTGVGNMSLHHRDQIGSGAHPASYPMGTRGSFPLGKSGQGVKLTTHLHLVSRPRVRGAIYPLPQYAFMAWCSFKVQEQFHLYLYFIRM